MSRPVLVRDEVVIVVAYRPPNRRESAVRGVTVLCGVSDTGPCPAGPAWLEELCLFRRRGADVGAAELRDRPAARRALEEAELEQERLGDVLDRARLLAERDGERGQPDGAAVELDDDRAEQRAVDPL